MQNILLTQFAATWFMLGLIWIIQIVHYPLFEHVGAAEFDTYAHKHQVLITFIVGPVMAIELVTAILLAWYSPIPETVLWFRLSLALLVIIWLSTALIQVPQHNRLTSAGFDQETIRGLVKWNWIRTVSWTIRGAILLVVLGKLLSFNNQVSGQ